MVLINVISIRLINQLKWFHDDFIDGIEDVVSRQEKPVSPLNIVKVRPGSSYSESTQSDVPILPKSQKVPRHILTDGVVDSKKTEKAQEPLKNLLKNLLKPINHSKYRRKKCKCN